jgi:hypothetical protein
VGLARFKLFPKVDAVVIDAELKDNDLFAKQVKRIQPKTLVVCLTARIAAKSRMG